MSYTDFFFVYKFSKIEGGYLDWNRTSVVKLTRI